MKKAFAIAALVCAAFGLRAQTVSTIATNNLFEPHSIAIDLSSNLYYLSDSVDNRIVILNPADGSMSVLGAYPFFNPEGLVLARGGAVVADSGNHQIDFVDNQGSVTTIAGSTLGFQNGSGTSAKFSSPSGLAVDGAGNITWRI